MPSSSQPPCTGLATLHTVWQGLFQNPPAGRRLVHYFRDAGATDIQAGACTLVAHDTPTMKRLYRLSAEATGSTAEAKGILSSTEAGEMIADLIRLEEDPSSVVVKFPDIWVIAKR